VFLVAMFLLALFVLPSPWGLLAVGAGVVVELGEAWFWWWLSRRRKPALGPEAMVGSSATVITPCRPRGQVRIHGELWQADCPEGADPGQEVVVRDVRIDGLTLVVAAVAR
jgi:membrane protein implicated in regulation of membrane protease activity